MAHSARASNVMNFWWCKFHHCLRHEVWKFIAVSLKICTTRFRIWRRCSLPVGGNAFIDFRFAPIMLHRTQLMTAISLTQLMMVYGATDDLLQFSGSGVRRNCRCAVGSWWDWERPWVDPAFEIILGESHCKTIFLLILHVNTLWGDLQATEIV